MEVEVQAIPRAGSSQAAAAARVSQEVVLRT
jgi:hypothetical protein